MRPTIDYKRLEEIKRGDSGPKPNPQPLPETNSKPNSKSKVEYLTPGVVYIICAECMELAPREETTNRICIECLSRGKESDYDEK